MIYYIGGVSKENNIRYLTANTPPTDDNSNKVPTTEWVKEKLDDVEAAVSGGMFPAVSKAVYSNREIRVPSGGTWWMFAVKEGEVFRNQSIAGGSLIYNNQFQDSSSHQFLFIKIS